MDVYPDFSDLMESFENFNKSTEKPSEDKKGELVQIHNTLKQMDLKLENFMKTKHLTLLPEKLAIQIEFILPEKPSTAASAPPKPRASRKRRKYVDAEVQTDDFEEPPTKQRRVSFKGGLGRMEEENSFPVWIKMWNYFSRVQEPCSSAIRNIKTGIVHTHRRHLVTECAVTVALILISCRMLNKRDKVTTASKINSHAASEVAKSSAEFDVPLEPPLHVPPLQVQNAGVRQCSVNLRIVVQVSGGPSGDGTGHMGDLNYILQQRDVGSFHNY